MEPTQVKYVDLFNNHVLNKIWGYDINIQKWRMTTKKILSLPQINDPKLAGVYNTHQ